MKKNIFAIAAFFLLGFLPAYSQVAQVTALPKDIVGRNVSPTFTISVNPDGSQTTSGGGGGGAVYGSNADGAAPSFAPVLSAGKGADGFVHTLSTTNAGVLNVAGTFTGSSAAVGIIAATAPTSADYQGVLNGANLIGALGDSSGRQIVAGGGTAGSPAGGVLSIQGVGSGTAIPASQSGTWNVGSITTLPALPSNQSVNNSQINGVTPLMGNGVTGTGSQRVTIASDNTAFSVNATQSGTWNIGTVTTLPALPANQTVNNAQVSGTAVSVNNGVAGAGVQRVVIASDQTAYSVNSTDASTSATGSAVPAKANYIGGNSGGNLTGIIQADTSTAINISTATTTQLVALSSGKKIYVTAWDVIAAGTGNITLVYGTGSTCGTGTTSLTGAYNLVAQAGISKGGSLGPVLVVPASNALCATTSAAVQMSGSVAYTQF